MCLLWKGVTQFGLTHLILWLWVTKGISSGTGRGRLRGQQELPPLWPQLLLRFGNKGCVSSGAAFLVRCLCPGEVAELQLGSVQGEEMVLVGVIPCARGDCVWWWL